MACDFNIEYETIHMRGRAISELYIKRLIYRLSHWETWHWLIKYVPMVPFWIAHCVRARSVWFFSAANPTLTFGGFEGETKHEMYSLLPKGSFPKTFLIRHSMPVSFAEEIIHSGQLSFPVAVKPDVGRMGLMFRKINSVNQLRQYHKMIHADYLLQEYVDYPLEVSVFYYRMPGEMRGTISGFVRKESLRVTGDGESTLLDLMNEYPRVWFRMDEMKTKHADRLNHIIPKGEIYVLSDALNLSRGGKLVSLETEKDDRLLQVFDGFSHHGEFYFGRFDVRCKTIDGLRAGKNFSILEFNGSGAEPHHVYSDHYPLWKAIAILLHHWNILCNISIENNRRGVQYWSLKSGLEHLEKARHIIENLRSLESDSTASFNHLSSQDETTTAPATISPASLQKLNSNASI